MLLLLLLMLLMHMVMLLLLLDNHKVRLSTGNRRMWRSIEYYGVGRLVMMQWKMWAI